MYHTRINCINETNICIYSLGCFFKRCSCRKTEEGYVIYTEDELGFGKKGGDTDLCPFDCDCCF